MGLALAADFQQSIAFDNGPDDRLFEIVDGRRVEKEKMSALANLLATQLLVSLSPAVNNGQLGRLVTESVFYLRKDGRLQRRPDVAFVSADRWPLDKPVPYLGDWPVAPNLAIEVNSPNNRMDEVIAKIRHYFAAGVQEVWVALIPDRSVLVYTSPTIVRTVQADEILATPLIPGWSIRVGDWIPEIDPLEMPVPTDD